MTELSPKSEVVCLISAHTKDPLEWIRLVNDVGRWILCFSGKNLKGSQASPGGAVWLYSRGPSVYKKTERRPPALRFVETVSYLRIRLIKPNKPPRARSDNAVGSGISSGVEALPIPAISSLVKRDPTLLPYRPYPRHLPIVICKEKDSRVEGKPVVNTWPAASRNECRQHRL